MFTFIIILILSFVVYTPVNSVFVEKCVHPAEKGSLVNDSTVLKKKQTEQELSYQAIKLKTK